MKADQERVKTLLTDTVTLLCKNGLQYHKELRVQGLLGITLDENEVFLVQINEKVENIVTQLGTQLIEDFRESQSQSCNHFKQNMSTNNCTDVHSSKSYFKSRFIRQFSRERLLYRKKFSHNRFPTEKRCLQTENVIKNSVSSLATNNIVDTQNSKSPENNTQISYDSNVKTDIIKNELDDDDVIIMEQNLNNVADITERKAMMSTYLSEPSDAESTFAQNILSELSLQYKHQGGDQLSANYDSSDSNRPFITGFMTNQSHTHTSDHNSPSASSSLSPFLVEKSNPPQISNYSVALFRRPRGRPRKAVKISSSPPFRCPFENCSKIVKHLQSLECHIAAVHHHVRYSCPIEGCNHKSSYRQDVKKHVRAFHQQELVNT